MKTLKGGEYLIAKTDPTHIFSPEEFTEEQRMIVNSFENFIRTEIHPNMEKIEKQEGNINRELCKKVGDLGLFSTHMPENLGGLDLDFNTNTAIGESVGISSGSFSVTFNAHTGIGMLPILYFGTQEQKEKYLPQLMMGEWVASYCLTEPSSGSDALSAKTQAILSEDGTHYVLNGQKMWISNAGFADVFIVFAQIDGDKFSAFIIEKGSEGLTLGEEESKMGIKGSSTRMVFLENVKVPSENLLGEIGKGHLIAFNVLNTGRFKLAASALGGCKMVTSISVKYAKERKQFDTEIANFGAIKHKLAEMAIRSYVLDATVYRTSHMINEAASNLKKEGVAVAKAKLQAAKEYALESSILKVEGSETLDFCVDEAVQIHGGMGYSEETAVCRAYRDARINRIFEGTNEINRMVVLNELMRSAMKGKLDLVTPALAVQAELTQGIESGEKHTGNYALEYDAVANYKKLALMLIGSAMKSTMDQKIDLKEEQELMMNLSDIMIDIFRAESLVYRVDKLKQKSLGKQDLVIYEDVMHVFFHDTNSRIYKNALDAIGAFIEEDQHDNYLIGARKYTKYPIINTKEKRRNIADILIKEDGFAL